MQYKTKGFTIVELLICIAIIGILAAITIVTYNGIQNRARLEAARNGMKSFGQAVRIFQVDNGGYPTTPAEFSAILKSANLYNTTRTPATSFAICGDANGYAFVAWNPVIDTYKNQDILYMYSSSGGQSLYTLTNSSLSAQDQIDKVCDQVYPSSSLDAWTYDIP